MKNNYILNLALMLISFLFLSNGFSQVRIVFVDPSTNTVTLHNYGGSTQNVSTYWFCNFPSYSQVSGMSVISGSTNLASGAEVTVTSTVNFDAGDGEFGLYTTNASGFTDDMIDYLQWGSAGHQREGVANAAGIWVSGTFISDAPPFEYIGNGSQNGVNFWQTALSVDEFEIDQAFKIGKNPIESVLDIGLGSFAQEGTVTIHSVTGTKVFSQNIQGQTSLKIDVSNWSTGLYLVSLNSQSGSQTKRFVKL